MVRTPEGPSGQVVLCLPLRDGFRIGFRYGKSECRSATSNMQSALAHPEEVGKGRVLGPAPTDVCKSIHINRFGLVPKGSSGDSLWTCLSRKGPA